MPDTQESLPGTGPGHGGIWTRYLTAGYIDDAAWRHARETRQHVGTCKRCGQPLRPGRPYRVGPVTWYPAECISTVCDYETAAHGPRPVKAKGTR